MRQYQPGHLPTHFRLTTTVLTVILGTICFALRSPPAWAVAPQTETTAKTQDVQTFPDLSSREYQQTLDRWVPKAYRPSKITVDIVNGHPKYTVTMNHVTTIRPWLARHGLTSRQYSSFAIEQDELGYIETIHTRYKVRGETYHVSVFEKDLSLARDIVLPEDPLPEDGATRAEFAPLDKMMRHFLREHQIPGATIAVSRDGTIRYQRGFGYADLESKTPILADTKMRIASISKPITAVAILQLVEQKKLKLDEPFLPYILKHLSIDPVEVQDDRIAKVTILNLLQHFGGWDRDETFDPMFRSIAIANTMKTRSPASARTIMRYMLTTQDLSHGPATKYSYSNFGYSLLGRVIESVSGQDYSTFVEDNVLKKTGMVNTLLARSLKNQRATNETTYHMRHGETAPSIFGSINRRRETLRPYGAWAIEPMDSHGGWISSAGDLVRFGNAVRGWTQSAQNISDSIADSTPDPATVANQLLNSNSRRIILAAPESGPEKSVFYGCGWSVRNSHRSGKNNWHTGLLDGTSTILVCRSDRYCWAVLFNVNVTPDETPCASKIDSLVHRAVNSIRYWPTAQSTAD